MANVPVAPTNSAPLGAEDFYTLDEDIVLSTTALTGVLGNDVDGDGDILIAELRREPVYGTIAFNPDGSFAYTPDANFSGTDRFIYIATDGEAKTSLVRVYLTIDSVNDAPVALDSGYLLDEDTILERWLSFEARDPEGDRVTAAIVSGPSHGTLVLDPLTTKFTYTPDPDYNGLDGFNFKLNDGELDSNTAFMRLDVQPLPEDLAARNDGPYLVTHQGTLSIPIADLLANDSGDPLFFFDAREPQNGTIEESGGSIIFRADRGYAGEAEFIYYIADGDGGIDAATVYITVGGPLKGSEEGNVIVGAVSGNKLKGNGGNDLLYGLGGDDRLYGGAQQDTIVGGDGDDVLYGDNPSDSNDAEGYADTFVFDSNDGTDKVFDFEVGLDVVELVGGGSYTLEAASSGNTVLVYGATRIIFYDAVLTDADIVLTV